MHTSRDHQTRPRPPWQWWVGFGAFLLISVVLLWEEHRAHILGALPYGFLALCILLHQFMHGGHGHRSDDHDASRHRKGDAP